MRAPLRRTAIALALTTTVSIAAAGQADAATLAVPDARGDVVALDLATGATAPAPDVKNGDIVRTRFTYGPSRVKARVAYAELGRIGQDRGDWLRVVTNQHVRRDIVVSYAPQHWRGSVTVLDRKHEQVSCSGLEHTVDYTTNVVTISIPRSCLGNPQWVQEGFQTFWTRDEQTIYIDDAQRDGRVKPGSVQLSPQLQRG